MSIDKRRFACNSLLVSERQYFLYSHASINNFLSAIIDGTITGYPLSDLFKDDAEYISSIMYVPIDNTKFGAFTLVSMKLGKASIPTQAYEYGRIYPYIYYFYLRIDKKFNNFLDFAPYTKVRIKLPYFEEFEIDPLLLYDKTDNANGYQLTCYFSFDTHNGTIAYYLIRDIDGLLISHNETKIGIELSMGKSNDQEIKRNNLMNGISAVGGVVSTVLGAMTKNPLVTAMGISSLTTQTANKFISNNVQRGQSSKGTGNRTELIEDKRIYITIERYNKSVIDSSTPSLALKGKPAQYNDLLINVHGYTEIGEIHFNPFGHEIYDDEINEIVELLRSGVILP